MILTESDIKKIILENPNKALIQAGRLYNKEMRKHLYGENLEAALLTIEGYEKESLRNLRVKYAKSNKDVFNRLSRPIDKVFSARGGSVYYNLPETQEKKARALAMDVKGGMSVSKWVNSHWTPHYKDDPYGITFIEIEEQQKAVLLYSKGKSAVYPTYKSIQCIYDYQPNGSTFEYIVFVVGNKDKVDAGFNPEDKVFRVVDDAMDYYVKQDGENVSIVTDKSIPNYFGYVPAIVNSDIPDPTREHGRLSIFDEILEVANNFLMKGSIKLTYEFLFAFPKYWQYAADCKKCNGTKYVGAEECTECKGTGKAINSFVSDSMHIKVPKDKDDAVITPDVAGYVTPPKDYYDISTHDLQLYEDMMHYTLWGASNIPKTAGTATDASGPTKTATEITNEIKPQSDRLEPISECAQKVHKFILDAVVKIQVNQSYPGASVNYGKRYMIESPDAIWDKYSKARKDGAACSVLDDLLIEYYESKYNSDPVKLAIQMKLMRVEPFVHQTVQQLKGLGAGDDDYKAKLYFGEWLSTINEAMVISMSAEDLRKSMYDYTGLRSLAAPEPKQISAAA